MSNRKRRNGATSFLVNGVMVEGVENVRAAIHSHFSSHFQSRVEERPSMAGLHFRSLSHAEGGGLVKPFSLDEVKVAVWDCDNFKYSGLDKISFGFIKEFWDILKDDVIRFIVEFHRNGRLTKGINNTFIALIPKVVSPQRLNDFKPISLVGSMYKILSKLLGNRLRLIMGSVILDSQSAFIKGRQILDGILVSNAVVDEARKCNKDLLMFKVDFEKVYDSID